MTDKRVLVCYTDGSSQPNPGYAGYGVYGYVFSEAKRARNINYPVKTNYKYTSEGIMPVKEIPERLAKETIDVTDIVEHIGSIDNEHATNNQGEILGLLTALKYAIDLEVNEVLVISDSKYALDGFTLGLKHWEKNDWKTKSGTEVKNLDLWLEAKSIKEQLDEKKVKVKTKWVKGHESDEGNIVADIYALIGTNYARNQFQEGDDFSEACLARVTPMSEFKKELVYRHFIFDYKSALFHTSDVDPDRLMLVSTYNPFEEKDMGKRDIYGTYSLVVGNIPTNYGNLKKRFNKIPRLYHLSSLINLDTVKKDKLLTRVISIIGFDPIIVKIKDGHYNKLVAFNRDGVIVEELGPDYTHLLETYNTFNSLNNALISLESSLKEGKALDVTDYFIHDLDDRGKKAVNFPYHTRYLDLDESVKFKGLEFVSVPRLIIGMDTPKYTVFRDLIDDIENVYLFPDTENNSNLVTLVTIIKYKQDGKDCYVASTNLLNKYLVRHSE